ncbi:anaerobic benzoate catabolism transcriptional regulator [uncultured Eubacterium sp.]|nr:anaerobic benzoate catabolism transcriptional regulator [uncultured Eubacterium sp.]
MKLSKIKISMLRAKKGLSVKQLASLAKVSDRTITKGFTDEINPMCIGRIANALGAQIEDIIFEEETASSSL